MNKPLSVTGWDIGGANVKAVRLDRTASQPERLRVVSRPFELWRDPDGLEQVLAQLGSELDAPHTEALGLTMTAELADVFRSKAQGVEFICRTVAQVFPNLLVLALNVSSQQWRPLQDVFARPLDFAANNWMASALYLASSHPDAVFIDVGSTTTDIIPIRSGRVAARGRTDTDRLTCGELVYTGVLRTNPNTVTGTIPIKGLPCRVADELFARMADVHLLLGRITEDEYSCPTADGRGKSLEEAAGRLARVVCADSDVLPSGQIVTLSRYLFECQLNRIAQGLHQVLSAWDGPEPPILLSAGSGAFMVKELARRLGFPVLDPLPHMDRHAKAVLPALGAASLVADLVQGNAP